MNREYGTLIALPKRLIAVLLLMLLAGCNTPPATPDPNGPILGAFDSLPKSLATVAPSPSPNATEIQATVASRPTSTIPAVTMTPTVTPYVGIFMGAPTFSANSLQPTGTRQVAVITLTPQPGTKIASNPTDSISGSSSGGKCTIQPAGTFANAARNATVTQRLGCPTAKEISMTLVVQPFQNGFMFWRETKEIYVLATGALRGGIGTDTYWRVIDRWTEGQPANDPVMVPPAGLQQPIRGFGLVWRSVPAIRNAIGWATAGEQPYTATWQAFEHGWMMTNSNGGVLALSPADSGNTTGIHFGMLQ